MKKKAALFIAILGLAISTHAASLTSNQLQNAIAADLTKVAEFQAIKAEAAKRGLRVWLFGGTAASFGHYAKWDEERKAGDTKYQPERFDYDYTNIYRSTQDMDLAVDGTPEQSESFKSWLTKEYPYFEGDKGAGWDVRSLKHKTPRMDALLNDKDFSNQHTDSNSTGMIEITDPPAGEVRIRDVRAWDSKTPPFFDDVLNGKLHFYYSPEHKTTRLYKDGSNPEITSVIRYLTKAFQYDLKIPPEEEAKIKPIIDAFNASDVGVKPEYSNWKNWIEKHGKKLMRHAVDMEYAQSELDRLGLRKKLIAVRKDADILDTLAWWLNKEPLKSKPVGQGSGKTARELATSLGVKPGDPIIVTHETNSLLAHESITKSHRGELNAFISRVAAPGEAAAEGPGFYTQLGEEGARGTKLPIRMQLNPNAREGTDFSLQTGSRYFVITNKNAVTVIPESLNIGPVEYFKMLDANSDILVKNKAVAERLKRRVITKLVHLTIAEKSEIGTVIENAIHKFDGMNSSPVINASYDLIIDRTPALKQAYTKKLEQLIENGDQRVLRRLADEIFSQPHTKDMQGLIKKVIEKGDQTTLGNLTQYTFSQPHTKDMQILIENVIEKGDQNVLRNLAAYTFSQLHTKDMQGSIEKLIEKSSADLGNIAANIFSKPHTKDMQSLMQKVIEKGDPNTLWNFACYIFSQPHTKDMQSLMQKVIEKGDRDTLKSFAVHTFSQPHTKDMQRALDKLIEKSDEVILENLAKYTFSQPHTKDMQGLVSKLIERGGRSVRASLVLYTFSQPHTKDMSELIERLIDEADQNELWSLAQHTFSQPHTKDMKGLLQKLIERGNEQVLQRLRYHVFSHPHTKGTEYDNLRKYFAEAEKSWNLYPRDEAARNKYLSEHSPFKAKASSATAPESKFESSCAKALQRGLGL